MVKVTKVAVWKIGNTFIESAVEATREVRRIIALELLEEGADEQLTLSEAADWIADNHDSLEAKVKAAMAGA